MVMSDLHGDAGDVADQRSAEPPLPLPGWYQDPWSSGHHRYWDGQAWTPDVFADVPPAGTETAAWPSSPAPWAAPWATPTPAPTPAPAGPPPAPAPGFPARPAPPPQW